ncbi:hypothetical protein KGF54_003084 [Candida jiufengensis]|uniref:uncharacterized protein n=1 Tax=Candida jiufengensis TaxID=497108 RepID=UPI002224EDFD|nr:uncharacterized protein KGF54_003084 [Candida jiufengensis]KAI5953712.1 hypothetical protein KGF54_003084 [Candida jiufengensis]
MNSIYSSSETNSSVSLEDYKNHLITQHQTNISQYDNEQHMYHSHSFSSSKSDPILENTPLIIEGEPNIIQSPIFDNDKTPVLNNFGFSNDYDTPVQESMSSYTIGSRKSIDDPFKSPTSINNLSFSTKGSLRRKPPPDLLDQENAAPSDETQTTTYETDRPKLSTKFKRLSMNNFNNLGLKLDSFKRSTSMRLLSPSKSPESDQHKYSVSEEPKTSHQLQSPIFDPFAKMSPVNSSSLDPRQQSLPPFWKYHILKFGKDLYLTTNPGTKHVFCRNGPGFYIEIINNSDDSNSSKINSKDGYTLIFKDSDSIEQLSKKSLMTITKNAEKEGGSFVFSIPKDKYVDDEGNVEKYEDLTLYNGVTFQSPISDEYFPYKNLRNRPEFFKNYEIKDLHKQKWNIGSIPRVRLSKMNQMRERIKRSSSDNQNDELKLVNKRNIYFHQNYITGEGSKYKEPNPRNIYSNESTNIKFPPVLSMFRPFENRIKKSFLQMAKNQQNSANITTQSNDSTGDSKDINRYYNGSDGLYYSRNTQDDTPDENKLGWITIYEDDEIFKGAENRGMFDIVLGLTLAIGFDSTLK